MVDVDMSPTPPKVIGREVCLRIKGLSKLLKDLGVHCKKYNGCYTKPTG